MKRETQDKWINIGSSILTGLVIAIVGYFSISSYQKIQQSALNDDAVKISDENKIAKSERIDTQEVENELNRIAEEKRLEQERVAAEKAAREKAAREKLEAEKRAAEKAAQEKIAREKAEQARIEAEKKAAEKREAERIATEKAAAEKKAQEKLAQEKAAQEKADAERKAAEQKIAEQKAAEEKLAAEKAETERLEKERLEKERLAAEKRAADKKAQEAKEAEEAARIASALSSEYFSQVHAYLYALWITPPGSYGLNTTIQFKVKEDGTIIGTPIIKKSSGNEEFDNSVFVSIMSADKIPMPNDPIVRKYLAKEGFEITFKPTN